MSKGTILVAGGGGFIGGHLVAICWTRDRRPCDRT